MLSVLLRSGDGRAVPTNQQEEIGMEATVQAPSAQTRNAYTSRPGAFPATTPRQELGMVSLRQVSFGKEEET